MDTCVNNNGEISSWRSNWQLKDGLLRAHFEFILAALLVHFMSKMDLKSNAAKTELF